MSVRGQWILGAVVSAIALALTWILDDFFLFRLALAASWAVAVLGLNLLTGFNGQISLGHGTFMGIGMYTVAITNRDWGLSYPLAFLLAIAICLVVGALIGIPALRLPGTSLALITLAMALAFPQLLRKYESVTGGVQGIGISGDSQFLSPTDSFSRDQFRYLVVVAITIVVFLLAWNLVRGRWGLAMMAVRDNPVAAASMGVNLPRTKVVTFAISGALAGLGGAMQMMLNNSVFPDSLTLLVSISLLTGIVIGGLGTVSGAIIGGIFIQYLPIWSQQLSDELPPGVIQGAIIILVMILAPGGIVGLFRRLRAAVERRLGRTGSAARHESAAEFPTTTEEPVPGAHGI